MNLLRTRPKPGRHARVEVQTQPVPEDHTRPMPAVQPGPAKLPYTRPVDQEMARRARRQPRFVPIGQLPGPRRVRPYIPGAPSLSREAVLRSERAVIANSMRRFTLPCDFCHREHYNAQARTFAWLRQYAAWAGWQQDGTGRWRCPRCVRVNPAAPQCVRSNPANLPVLARDAALVLAGGKGDAA